MRPGNLPAELGCHGVPRVPCGQLLWRRFFGAEAMHARPHQRRKRLDVHQLRRGTLCRRWWTLCLHAMPGGTLPVERRCDDVQHVSRWIHVLARRERRRGVPCRTLQRSRRERVPRVRARIVQCHKRDVRMPAVLGRNVRTRTSERWLRRVPRRVRV